MDCRLFGFNTESTKLVFRISGLLAVVILISCSSSKLAAQESESDVKTDEAKPASAKVVAVKEDSANDESPDKKTEEPAETKSDQDLEESLNEILQGHSAHGEAFNEGPRQAAYIMGGTGNINFPVTTKSEEAQAFINQGVGQLHGFWYLEAERSFRQAAAIDEKCAMAYWGAAMAAYSQRKRSQGFIAKAVELKDSATDREKMYIDALEGYFSDKVKDKKKRATNFLKDLESIVIKYPDDIEAKAFVAHRVWHNAREGTPVSSYLALNSLIQEILAVEPLHPAHHYTIHLWDLRHPEKAVRAAARCGVSAPSIAHMWHMPGHIYSRLKRYEDAVFQQEASARVDHAHMIRDRVMPDEISNFAHNNEWLIRNLIFIGKYSDALSLAKNMIELPQHPKYNTLEKQGGSASYGRRRLLQILREFQQYEQAIALCQSKYLNVDDSVQEQVKTARLLGCSAAIVGQIAICDAAKSQLSQFMDEKKSEQKKLKRRIAGLNAALDTSEDRPPRPTEKKFDPKKGKLHLKEAKADLAKAEQVIKQIDKANMAVEGYQLAGDQEFSDAQKKLQKATGEDVSWLGELKFLGGDTEGGLKSIADQVRRRPQETIPLARLAYFQYQNGDMDLATESFNKLRNQSGSIDLGIELFARLEPLARELEYGADWVKQSKPAIDLGFRPPLDSLGPFRWSPSPAPTWTLKDSDNKTASSDDYAGKPYVLIFYLGHGCLHCAEQLNAFAPRTKDFENAGMQMVAISSDDQDGLKKSIENYNDTMPIRLASDNSNDVFKKFRAFDDFENQPLHGTFLIDGKGQIRWQDISYEPFMDHEFLLNEAKRLLADELGSEAQAGKESPKKQVSQR